MRARVVVVVNDPQTGGFARDALFTAGYAALLSVNHGEFSRIRAGKPGLVRLDVVPGGAGGAGTL